jgi:hypothetical protein
MPDEPTELGHNLDGEFMGWVDLSSPGLSLGLLTLLLKLLFTTHVDLLSPKLTGFYVSTYGGIPRIKELTLIFHNADGFTILPKLNMTTAMAPVKAIVKWHNDLPQPSLHIYSTSYDYWTFQAYPLCLFLALTFLLSSYITAIF